MASGHRSPGIDPKKPGGEQQRAKILDAISKGRRKGKTRGYRYYDSDLSGTTRYFAGINPEHEIFKLEKSLHRKPKVLELGCGIGATLKGIERTNAELFGTNLNFEKAHKSLKAKIFICHFGQLREKLRPIGPLDFIYANASIPHSAHFLQDIQTISGLLRSGGRFLFNYPLFSREEYESVEKALTKNGFEIIKVKYADIETDVPPYVFYAQKK
ncbi:MAG: class I SAM-dependent methyltransferase [archaeon]|nr:class I SAM-dependent methyltransferase [archaeon]